MKSTNNLYTILTGSMMKGMMITLMISMTSCISLAKNSSRKLEKKTFRPCHKSELENHKGKVCRRYCYKKKFLSKKCKEYRLDVFIYEDIQDSLAELGFVIIDEDRIIR